MELCNQSEINSLQAFTISKHIKRPYVGASVSTYTVLGLAGVPHM